MVWRGESYHAGAKLLQQPGALGAGGWSPGADALHAAAQQEGHAAARVRHAASLRTTTDISQGLFAGSRSARTPHATPWSASDRTRLLKQLMDSGGWSAAAFKILLLFSKSPLL